MEEKVVIAKEQNPLEALAEMGESRLTTARVFFDDNVVNYLHETARQFQVETDLYIFFLGKQTLVILKKSVKEECERYGQCELISLEAENISFKNPALFPKEILVVTMKT